MARATIYADASGVLLRYLQGETEHAQYPTPPTGTTQTVTFDSATNPITAATILSDWGSYRVASGVLQRNGVAVALAADAEDTDDARQLPAALDAIRTYLAATGTTRTDAQRIAFERNVGRVLRYLARRLA